MVFQSYDRTHWEELVTTIIDRIGMETFLETVSYVAEQKGYREIAIDLGKLTYSHPEVTYVRFNEEPFSD